MYNNNNNNNNNNDNNNNNNNNNNNRNTSIVIMELINSLIVFIYHLQVPLNKKISILSKNVYFSNSTQIVKLVIK